jgi:hypothetical protein
MLVADVSPLSIEASPAGLYCSAEVPSAMAMYDSPMPAGPASGLIVRNCAVSVPKDDAKTEIAGYNRKNGNNNDKNSFKGFMESFFETLLCLRTGKTLRKIITLFDEI